MSKIGNILDAMEASGKMGNIYIFMTSDLGLSLGHHGLIRKQSLFDYSIRASLMVIAPNIPKGRYFGTIPTMATKGATHRPSSVKGIGNSSIIGKMAARSSMTWPRTRANGTT